MDKTKHNLNRRNFIVASTVTGLGLTLNLYSCTKKSDPAPKDDGDKDPDNKLIITGVSIPLFIDIQKESELNIKGKGFKDGDKIILKSLTASNIEYSISVKSVTDESTTIILPIALLSDKYRLTASRGTNTSVLGSTTLNIVVNANIPDKAGMTIKGVVHSGGIGLANVVVSDGIEVTKTDSNGIYYLASSKKNKLVFVSIPGNYEVTNDGSLPLFFNRVTRPVDIVEIHDFSLTEVNNEKHVLLALGDMHLANRTDDIKQFQEGFLVDVNQTIQSYKSAGTKVYAVALGDMTWESYWFANNYNLQNYRNQMNAIKAPVFNTIGNHDNHPYVADNWHSENAFRDILGPTYYSFNLGKVHYIVLDNVEYLNIGASQGTIGDRTYNAKIVDEQMAWLRKDLAMIEDKSTPIMIAMHIQLNNNPSVNGSSTKRLTNADEFINVLSSFSKVNILTGHTHIQYKVENSPSLMEHNSAAVCATWWWTGFKSYAAKNQICKDGTPGGYGVWEMENKDVEWYYKSTGYNRDYQFRAYDLNKAHITVEKYAPNYIGTNDNWKSYASVYADPNTQNEVLINVWGYDSRWDVKVTELGSNLPVTRVSVRDPLHIISYSAQRLNVNAVPTTDFVTSATAHMFKVKASNATNPLEITVTDRFGNVFKETMSRPKELTYSMR